MNEVLVNKTIEKLKFLKQEGATITDVRVTQVINCVSQIYGLWSDELAVIAKAADRIFNAESKDL